MIYLIIIIGVSILAIAIFFLRNVFFSVKNDTILKHLQQKNYQEAIKLLKKQISDNDRNPFAHFYLGEVYFQMDNMEYALPHFRKVISMNRYNDDVSEVKTRERLAEIFLHFQQLEEAQKEFLLILNLRPDDFHYYYNIGEIFYQRHYKDNAAAYFQKTLDHNPSHAPSLFRMGEILYENKRPSDAMLKMKACLKADSTYHRAHYYIGMAYLDSRNYLQAISEFEQSIKDSEYRLRSLYQKGRALVESNNIDKGIVELDRGLGFIQQEDNHSLALRYLLAQCYERKRDLQAALEQWEIVSMVNPDYREVQDKLSEYSDLRADDTLKDFLTASDSKFEALCKTIVQNLGMEIIEINVKRGSLANIVVSEKDEKWMAQRKIKEFIRVFRINDKLGDNAIREMLEEMKSAGASKGIMITSSEFTRQAIEYAESRPVELFDKTQLSKLLKR